MNGPQVRVVVAGGGRIVVSARVTFCDLVVQVFELHYHSDSIRQCYMIELHSHSHSLWQSSPCSPV